MKTKKELKAELAVALGRVEELTVLVGAGDKPETDAEKIERLEAEVAAKKEVETKAVVDKATFTPASIDEARIKTITNKAKSLLK